MHFDTKMFIGTGDWKPNKSYKNNFKINNLSRSTPIDFGPVISAQFVLLYQNNEAMVPLWCHRSWSVLFVLKSIEMSSKLWKCTGDPQDVEIVGIMSLCLSISLVIEHNRMQEIQWYNETDKLYIYLCLYYNIMRKDFYVSMFVTNWLKNGRIWMKFSTYIDYSLDKHIGYLLSQCYDL